MLIYRCFLNFLNFCGINHEDVSSYFKGKFLCLKYGMSLNKKSEITRSKYNPRGGESYEVKTYKSRCAFSITGITIYR